MTEAAEYAAAKIVGTEVPTLARRSMRALAAGSAHVESLSATLSPEERDAIKHFTEIAQIFVRDDPLEITLAGLVVARKILRRGKSTDLLNDIEVVLQEAGVGLE